MIDVVVPGDMGDTVLLLWVPNKTWCCRQRVLKYDKYHRFNLNCPRAFTVRCRVPGRAL